MSRRTFTVDFETTGIPPAPCHPIEAAVLNTYDGDAHEWLIALPSGVHVPPETSAVHHIIDADLVGADTWDAVLGCMQNVVSDCGRVRPDQVVMIAHNADFERAVLAGTWFADCRWVCTFKSALRVWPDAPSHSNEALRYWLHLGARGRGCHNASHSAAHDAHVTCLIFELLCHTLALNNPDADPIETMIQWSSEVAVLPVCPIGKERGKKWADIDGGFLSWCLRQADMREDVKYAAQKELTRRAASRK